MLEAERTEGYEDDTVWAVAVSEWAQDIADQAQYPVTLWCFRDKVCALLEYEPQPAQCWQYMLTIEPRQKTTARGQYA